MTKIVISSMMTLSNWYVLQLQLTTKILFGAFLLLSIYARRRALTILHS